MLLGLHEAPYLKHNKHGLLSTGQAREHGTCVDDTLRRHGGGQRIAGHDNNGTPYNFDLDVTNGLFDFADPIPHPGQTGDTPHCVAHLCRTLGSLLLWKRLTNWSCLPRMEPLTIRSVRSVSVPKASNNLPTTTNFGDPPWLAPHRHHPQDVRRDCTACWNSSITVTSMPPPQVLLPAT